MLVWGGKFLQLLSAKLQNFKTFAEKQPPVSIIYTANKIKLQHVHVMYGFMEYRF